MRHSYPGDPKPDFFNSEESEEDKCDENNDDNESYHSSRKQVSEPKNMNVWLNLITFCVISWIVLKIISKGSHFMI